MLKKFWYLTRYGLKKKFKSKSFIISNIALLILIVGIVNINTIISFFGGDFDNKVNVYVVDNTNKSYDLFEKYYKTMEESIENGDNIKISKSEEDKDKTIEKIKGTTDIIVELNEDKNNYINANIITENYINPYTQQVLVQVINNTKYEIALIDSKIDINKLNKISQGVNIERVILDESKNTEDENMDTVMSVVFPTVILPFFTLIILLIQLIGGEINEEKTTRSMEVIISNVPPKVHFFSKLLACNAFIITQALLVFVYAFLGFLVKGIASGTGLSVFNDICEAIKSVAGTGLLDKLYYIIPLTLVLLLLTFVAYSLIAGIFASMTVNPEDFQHIQTPIMIMCMLSYYLAIMAGMFNGSAFIRVLSYVPLISYSLSPALLIIGQIGIIDVLISIVVLILFVGVLVKYGLKIYKVGVLNYSTDKLLRRIFKASKM